jgi:hypothetical protein
MVGIDSQSIIRGREQKTQLIEENTSMMSKRNLHAPMPPGSQLTDSANISKVMDTDKAVTVVKISERTLKEEYAMRRQSRTVAYRKQRKDFFEGDCITPAATASTVAQTTTKALRSPSRYLKALWKFEPERKIIARLMYPGCDSAAEDSEVAAEDVKILLQDILEPMVKLCMPEKKRYNYRSASPTQDMRCSVCDYQFIKNTQKYV